MSSMEYQVKYKYNPFMRSPQAITFASEEEEQVIVDKVEPKTTFFYMGLDIPVKNTEAIQRF